MSSIIRTLYIKDKKATRHKEVAEFMRQIGLVKDLYLDGTINEVLIIARGKEKCCTSNSISVATSKDICRDFIENSKEYTG